MSEIRVAVLGVGHMGRFHAEKLRLLCERREGVRLAGVADRDPERAAQAGRDFGVPHATNPAPILPLVDAAVVAVPTERHFEVVGQALAAGLDVLVEKPIAASVEEGQALLAQAKAGGRILQVGHLEWYNAAMRAIRGMVERPLFLEVHRLGPFVGRATDVDVVRDLMIHDLDIVQRLLGEEPERVEAVGVPVLSDTVDIANARLGFPGGCVANLTASRITAQPMRKLRFFQRDGYFSIDFLAQTAAVFRRILDPAGGAPRIEMEELKIDRNDALESELLAFLRAIRSREPPPGSGPEALAALRTALRVMEAIPRFDPSR
jgi:predicted dehydrogenase